MKRFLLPTIVLCFAGMTALAQGGAKPKSKPAAVKPAAKPVMKSLLDSFSYAAGVNVATNMKAQGISTLNAAMMQKGLDDVFKNKTPQLTPEQTNACMQRQLEIFAAAKNAEAMATGNAFLENNKKRDGITVLPSGLQYEVIRSGKADGISPKLEDTVEVNYIGRYIDGTEFENSYKNGQPAAFPLGAVIKGWVETLLRMKPSDHWKVYIPSELAYGAAGNGVIPPNAVLVFDIILENVRTAAPKSNE